VEEPVVKEELIPELISGIKAEIDTSNNVVSEIEMMLLASLQADKIKTEL
jgi:hypothetical protein